MKFVATIQARMGSSRLPGKVLMEGGGKPFLLHQVERVRRANKIEEVIVATTDQPCDDLIEQLCSTQGISIYRGSEDDVLGRVAACLQSYKGWGHVELVGDSPFVDPTIVDAFIEYFVCHMDDIDYVSNGIEITYPNGAEVNVYRVDTLLECETRVAAEDPMREHVDVHLYQSGYYRCVNMVAPPALHRPDLYIEIDTPHDYQVLRAIASHFADIEKPEFSLSDIVDFLDQNPDVADMNRHEHRKYWGVKEIKRY